MVLECQVERGRRETKTGRQEVLGAGIGKEENLGCQECIAMAEDAWQHGPKLIWLGFRPSKPPLFGNREEPRQKRKES